MTVRADTIRKICDDRKRAYEGMETRQSTTQGNLLGTSEGERRTTNNDERRRLYGEQIIYDGGRSCK